jgi:hypothetical protein
MKRMMTFVYFGTGLNHSALIGIIRIQKYASSILTRRCHDQQTLTKNSHIAVDQHMTRSIEQLLLGVIVSVGHNARSVYTVEFASDIAGRLAGKDMLKVFELMVRNERSYQYISVGIVRVIDHQPPEAQIKPDADAQKLQL